MSDVFKPYRLNDELIDVRKTTNHPITLKYTEVYKEVLLDADITLGRVTPYFKLCVEAPFYCAAKAGLSDSTRSKILAYSSLSVFYDSFKPKNICEWFNIKFKSEKLSLYPPYAGLLPWRARTISNFQEIIEKGTFLDNKANGLDLNIKQSGWAYCGPVSEAKCLVEADRIAKLIESIKENGYVRNNNIDGDIVATALINKNNDWVWLLTNGYHRAAVLAAMGYTKIPVRINLVVRRDEVSFWPQVSNGLYTKSEALKIFDNLFNRKTND